MVYAVPNDCRSELLNAEDVPGRILLVNRGEVRELLWSSRLTNTSMFNKTHVSPSLDKVMKSGVVVFSLDGVYTFHPP